MLNEIAVVPWVEVLAILRGFEVDQGGEKQDHVSPFVHDGCSAVCTADLARQLVNAGFLGALVPAKVVMAMGEIDVVLVEDCGPLERGACKLDQYWVLQQLESGSLPWIFWHVVQWQNLASNGFSRLN